MKIAIIGYSGCGKSSFAKKIGNNLKLDVTHLDRIAFNPGWVMKDRTMVKEELDKIIENDNWLIEGNYFRVEVARFAMADQIFIFNFNRFKCLYGAILRRIKFHNKSRSSSAEGNKEKLDLSFLWWLIHKGRRSNRKRIKLMIKTYSSKVIVFKKRRQVNDYLKSIGISDFKACP